MSTENGLTKFRCDCGIDFLVEGQVISVIRQFAVSPAALSEIEITDVPAARSSALIAQEDDLELLEWLAGAARRGGDFVSSIARAGLVADYQNYPLIRPLLLQMRAKYQEYEPSDEVKREIRDRKPLPRRCCSKFTRGDYSIMKRFFLRPQDLRRSKRWLLAVVVAIVMIIVQLAVLAVISQPVSPSSELPDPRTMYR